MNTSKWFLLVAFITCNMVCNVYAVCKNASDCIHKGICNGHVKECLCRIGWTGTACETNTSYPLRSMSSNHFASYNLANGAIIPCTVDEECVFPIYTRTFSGSASVPFSIGPVSEGITVETGTPKEDEHQGTLTALAVKTSTPGNKAVCLYHGPANSLCYQIIATTFKSSSSFIAPTYPDGTTIPCGSHICHLHIYTERANQSCSANLVTVANGTTASTFSSEESNKNQSCVTEMAFLATSGYLCVQYITKSRLPICYTITDRTRLPDPCINKTCSGHGACLAAGAEGTCICYSSYEGKDCEKSTAEAVQKGDSTAMIVAVSVAVPLVIAILVIIVIAVCCFKKHWGKLSVSPEEKTSPDSEKGRENDEKKKPGQKERRLRKNSLHLVD